MNATDLTREIRASVLWFGGLVAGGGSVAWLILDSFPDDAGLLWLVRAIVLSTHLLIWRHAVGPLHDVPFTGRLPGWLVTVHHAWFGWLLLFQLACIFCLPILDMLSPVKGILAPD